MTAAAPAQPRAVLLPDLLLASLVAALMVIGSGVSLDDDFEISVPGGRVHPWLPDPVGLLVLLAGSLSLTFRRVAPLTVLGVSGTAAMTYQALGYRSEPLPLAVLVALYTVAVVRRPLQGGVASAVYVVAFTAAALTGWLSVTDDQYYTDLVSVVATVTLGYGIALGRARASLAEQRTAALARDQDARVRAVVEQEQARIAREVHDVVAHDVSVIVAQAAAARRVLTTRPQTAADALASIEAVGRDALDGLRRLVGLLRTEANQSERSPQPSLDRLPWLLAQLRRAGLPVELVVRGRPGPLPVTVELNAFRIVQEALTNSLKHAGPTRATVVLDYEDEFLHLEVRDEGSAALEDPTKPVTGSVAGSGTGSATGYGLISMQQRVALLGGELSAEREHGRGFRVSARLPLAGGTSG
jgi:signal transduction histidine kinase